jgi:toxin ParE1/3/4
MKLRWSPRAELDRDEIFDYIEADSPRNAVEVDERIEIQVEELLRMPGMGRPGRVKGTRELILRDLPYIAVYALRGEMILILRVLHGARRWTQGL